MSPTTVNLMSNSVLIHQAHFAGRLVALDEPGDLDPRQIASTLARICRFGGNLRDDWPVVWHSVADHSVLVAGLLDLGGCDARTQLVGLYHDAHEALFGDIVTPVKNWIGPALREREDVLAAAVLCGVGIDDAGVDWDAINMADARALAIEVRLLGLDPVLFGVSPESLPEALRQWLRWSGILRENSHLSIGYLIDAGRDRFLEANGRLRKEIAS